MFSSVRVERFPCCAKERQQNIREWSCTKTDWNCWTGSAGWGLQLRSCRWGWIPSKSRNCLAGSHLIPDSCFTANTRHPRIDNPKPVWTQEKLFGGFFPCQSRKLPMLFNNVWFCCNILSVSLVGIQCSDSSEASKVCKSGFRVKPKKSQPLTRSEHGLGSAMSSLWVHSQQADIFQTLRAPFPCTDGNLAWKVHSKL